MNGEYLIGQLSVLLEQLEAATARRAAPEVAGLRYQVETGPLTALPTAAIRALAVADDLCWDSLSRGDTAAFARQAQVAADMCQFAVCTRLLADS
jgi:hypothetical protein